MAEDLGLLAGLAEGLRGGIRGFQEERTRRDELGQRQKSYALDLAKSGFEEAPDGTFRVSAAALAKEKAKADAERAQKKLELIADSDKALVGKGYLAQRDESGGLLSVNRIPGFVDEDTLYRRLQTEKLLSDLDKERHSKTPLGRLEGVSGDKGTKIGLVASALTDLTKYEDTFRQGGRRTRTNPDTPLLGSFISSTPIDEASTKLSDTIGRLRSGGAISVDEGNRFLRMLPTAADGDESASRKLLALRTELESVLAGYGFNPDELGASGRYNLAGMGYGTEFAGKENRGLLQPKEGLIKGAHAAGGTKPDFSKMTEDQLKAYLGQ